MRGKMVNVRSAKIGFECRGEFNDELRMTNDELRIRLAAVVV